MSTASSSRPPHYPLPPSLLACPAFDDLAFDDVDYDTPPGHAHWVGHISGKPGVFWTPATFDADNPGLDDRFGAGITDAAFQSMPFLFAEVDPAGTDEQQKDPAWCRARIDEQLHTIAALVAADTLPHPTFLVLSGDPRPPNAAPGKSVHIYWQLEDPYPPADPARLATMAALAHALGGDTTLRNAARKMRYPGALDAGRHQTLVYIGGPTHTRASFAQWVARSDPPTRAAASPTATTPARIDIDFVDHPHLDAARPTRVGEKVHKVRCINPSNHANNDAKPSGFVGLHKTGRRFFSCSTCHTTWWDNAAAEYANQTAAAAPEVVAEAAARIAAAAPEAAALADLPATLQDGTGTSNAALLVHLMAADYLFIHESQEWARWSPAAGRWVLGGGTSRDVYGLALLVKDHHLSRATDKPSTARYLHAASRTGQQEMVTLAQLGGYPEVNANDALFDQTPGLLNVGGQTLVLDPQQAPYARPAAKTDYLTRSCPTPYDPTARCPRFERFILEVMDDNPVHAAFLQRAMGYALSGYCTEQKMFFMQGDGGNGKGVLQRAIADALGPDYCISAKAETFIEKRGDGGVPADLASFKGYRFVFPEELPHHRKMDSATLKSCTGQDVIKARLMRENFSEYQPQFNLFFSANPGYEIDVSDPAVRRRFVLIPFNRSFQSNPDRGLTQTLRAEAPGIVQWLIRGFDLYRQHGLAIPPEMVDAAAEVCLSGDIVQQFLDERTTTTAPTPQSTPLSNERLYAIFTSWCERNGERHVPSQRRLTQRLVSKKFRQQRTAASRFWPGLYEVPTQLAPAVARTPASRPPAPPQVDN